MRIEISKNGSIMRLNEKGLFHSFEGKPSYIGPDACLSWHCKGKLLEYTRPDGLVIKYGNSGNWFESLVKQLSTQRS